MEQAEADKEEASEGKKGKLFGKKKKDKKDEKIEELTDRLTRQMAEFDNFRKRTEKEKVPDVRDWCERYHREDPPGC